jgi:hypothetical protein
MHQRCNIDAHTRPKKDPDAIRARYRSEKQRKLIKKQYSMLTSRKITKLMDSRVNNTFGCYRDT